MEINTHNNNNNQRCRDYMQALEQERCKILVFQRELPLCLELVTQTIELCKQQLSGIITTTECDLQKRQLSECSEQTSSDAPILEEFIPIIKRASSHSDGEEEQESKKYKEGQNGNNNNNDDTYIKKSDWLRSVQLWNQSPDPPSKEDDSPRNVEVKKSGNPFKKDENVAPPVENPVPPVSNSSMAVTSGGGNMKEEKDGQSRKARRCWSPELHRRFLQALQQLGGSHLATPKQIRELMNVDGLTNDEVKSHLQKYRLHTRRSRLSVSNQNTTNTKAPQFVMMAGGLWMPSEYTAAMATTTAMSGDAASNGIYAPIASLPQPSRKTSSSPKKSQHKTPDFNDRDSERGIRLSSPATSSSTQTTSVY